MAQSDELQVLFVRVGPTLWTEQGRIVGVTDIPLAPSGVEVAREVARSVQGPRLATIYSARDEASRQTVEVLQEAFGGRARVAPQLHEIDLGLWEGILSSSFAEKFPSAARQWQENPGAVTAPEGESVAGARQRIVSETARLLLRHKASEGAVGMVLRPMAMAMVRLALDDLAMAEAQRVLENAADAEWRGLSRERLREIGEAHRPAPTRV
ncbi:MAG: histidine phosphatase family protein [Phycisphaerales bacterium]|nr:histidine phosphatase family protein [Phycisphaerales bacterium]